MINRHLWTGALRVALVCGVMLGLSGCGQSAPAESAENEDGADMIEETEDNFSSQPISSLIGKPVRVYESGAPLTMDYQEERVNIELDESGKVVKVWQG